MHLPAHMFRVVVLKPVIAVLRQVSSDGDWPEATLRRISAELVAVGLQTSRELRLGFPPDQERRRDEVRGLAGEIAAKLLIDHALGVL
mgnify:CR=1 FL=1